MNTHVLITSAIELSKTQEDQIKKAVQAKYGKNVEYTLQVDPTLVAGIKIAINSREMDGSIKNKLDQMKSQLNKAAAQ